MMAQYWLKRSQWASPEGPFGVTELKHRAQIGEITVESFVSADNRNWTPAPQVKVLFSTPVAAVQAQSTTRPGAPSVHEPIAKKTPEFGHLPPVSGPRSIPIHNLRDPWERTAKILLIVLAVPVWALLLLWIVSGFGVPLIIIGVIALSGYLTRLFTMAYIKAFAVRTSPNQFPEIHEAVIEASKKLGIVPPELYLMHDSVWNAFAARLAGKRIVVLLSGAVDAILLKGDISQLVWLVGHEIGHHACGHVGASQTFIMMGGWLPWFALWYKRRCELTCDRIGLYVAGNATSSIKAMCNMTVGAQLAEHMNVEEAIRQWHQHKGEFFVRYRAIYSTHPPNLFRMKRLLESAQELGYAS